MVQLMVVVIGVFTLGFVLCSMLTVGASVANLEPGRPSLRPEPGYGRPVVNDFTKGEPR
jgi:hypothetical protein